MRPIMPCLWFDTQAEEAVNFYVSLFPDSRIDAIVKAPMDYPGGKKGDVLNIDFTLIGQPYQALNGGPDFKFTPAVSLSVSCKDQAELDRLWNALLAGGGAPVECGWLTDRYGLSWQLVPEVLERMMTDPDPIRVKRVMEAFMKMVKFDIAALQAAYDQA